MGFQPMLGHVVLEVVFVEGSVGSSAEFTTAERIAILRDVYAGAALLTRLGAAWGRRQPVPVRDVCTFDVESREVRLTLDPATIPSSVPTGDGADPEVRALAESRDKRWMAAMMLAFGYPAGTPTSRYAHDARGRYLHTRRWGRIVGDVAVIFVTKYGCHWHGFVDSEIDATVLWYPALRDEFDGRLGNAIAHELGHVFDAPDEYGHCTITETGGFLRTTANSNCRLIAKKPPVDVPRADPRHQCLMDHTVPVACAATEEFWGWFDRDGDGVADALAPADFALSAETAKVGATIDIKGRNVWDAGAIIFRPPIFGDPVRAAAEVVSQTHIRVTIPQMPDGFMGVEFETRAGPALPTSTSALFIGTPPTVGGGPVVWGVIPAAAPAGERVKIVGAGLTSATSVSFGGIAADMSTAHTDIDDPFSPDNYVIIDVPAGGAGTVTVSVATPDGTSQPFPPFSDFTFA